MAKKKKAEQEKLEADIDALDEEGSELADMTPEEIEGAAARIVAGNTIEARDLRRTRKGVRYKLYRLRTEKEGKAPAPEVEEGFREHFESQPLFKGWKFFAILWDVALDDPMEVIARDHSEIEEWEAVVAARYPRLRPDGGIEYPDIKVRERVERLAQERADQGD